MSTEPTYIFSRHKMQPNPYAPPQRPYPDPNAPMHAPQSQWGPYVSPRSAGNLALILTGGVVALSFGHRAIDLVLLLVPALLRVAIVGGKLLGGLSTLIRLGSGISILIWVNRAAKNVRALGLPGLSSDPTTCVVWFFVPFVNFVMPCVVVSQIVRASQREPRFPFAVIVWWLAYLIASFASVAARLMAAAHTGADLTHVFAMNSLLTLFSAISFGALVLVVRRVNADQDAVIQTVGSR